MHKQEKYATLKDHFEFFLLNQTPHTTELANELYVVFIHIRFKKLSSYSDLIDIVELLRFAHLIGKLKGKLMFVNWIIISLISRKHLQKPVFVYTSCVIAWIVPIISNLLIRKMESLWQMSGTLFI